MRLDKYRCRSAVVLRGYPLPRPLRMHRRGSEYPRRKPLRTLDKDNLKRKAEAGERRPQRRALSSWYRFKTKPETRPLYTGGWRITVPLRRYQFKFTRHRVPTHRAGWVTVLCSLVHDEKERLGKMGWRSCRSASGHYGPATALSGAAPLANGCQPPLAFITSEGATSK